MEHWTDWTIKVSYVTDHVEALDIGAKSTDFDDDDGGGLMPRKPRPTSHSTFVSASSNNASGFIFDSKNNVQTSMGSWGNSQLNQQVCDAIGVYLTVVAVNCWHFHG
ncbi:hypothetical protein EZV62_027168 [Acer yangbiense]|uniref:Uncharacterized protein n=1 Tax=Acer yangbiense TaxID=1000413 RepID=A0A5C7GSX6_9ROSI|nr:hypothetical protein EZV62_027168 [Acer yangbiense]